MLPFDPAARTGGPGKRFRHVVSFRSSITCVTLSRGWSVLGRFCPGARGQGPWKGIPGSRRSHRGHVRGVGGKSRSPPRFPWKMQSRRVRQRPRGRGPAARPWPGLAWPDGSERDLPCGCESDETGRGSQPCDL